MIFEFNVLWLQNFLSIFESLSRMLLMQKISERSSYYKDLQTFWVLGLLQKLMIYFCEKLVGVLVCAKVQGLNFSQKYIIVNFWTNFKKIGHSLCLPLLRASTDGRCTCFCKMGLILHYRDSSSQTRLHHCTVEN